MTPLDPSLPGIARENRRQILNQVQYLEEKVRQAHRQNSETALRQTWCGCSAQLADRRAAFPAFASRE